MYESNARNERQPGGSYDGVAIVPRADGVLRVLIIARISTVHQDARSLEDQEQLCRRFVEQNYNGRVEYRVIASRGSGEVLDRQELADAKAAIESRRFDLLVVEDLGRICRRHQAVVFCELCEDAGTRLISLNDSIDTARGAWRMGALFASFRHESSNRETSQRIRRSLRNRFINGGIVMTFPYGYIKPPGAKSDAEVRKDPDAEPIIQEIFKRLEHGANYAEVADWLNRESVPLGPWARSRRWSFKLVRRLVFNPILKGVRERNRRISRRVNRTGRRQSQLAPPEELLQRQVPHLAHIEPARYDAVLTMLRARSSWASRTRGNQRTDPRAGVSRKRTAWPGQHAVCGICGHRLYWYGSNQERLLVCSNAKNFHCWNGGTANGKLAAPRIAAAVLQAIEQLPEFDAEFREQVAREADHASDEREHQLAQWQRELAQLDSELSNLVNALAAAQNHPALLEGLRSRQQQKDALLVELHRLRQSTAPPIRLPDKTELLRLAREAIAELPSDDPAFHRTMCRLVPSVEIFPVQLRDGGAIRQRARIRINTLSLVRGMDDPPNAIMESVAWVDLFEPCQRVRFMPEIVRLTEAGWGQKRIARHLGIHQPTVQRAMKLHRMMAALGTDDLYVLVREPRSSGKQFNVRAKVRYQFEPKPGYPNWPDR